MFKLVYEEKTGVWKEKKEPYTTIEVETEEDFKLLEERIEKQKAKKPLGADRDETIENFARFLLQLHKWRHLRNLRQNKKGGQ